MRASRQIRIASGDRSDPAIVVVVAISHTARISEIVSSGDGLSVVLAEATAAVATAVIVIEESINPELPLFIVFVSREGSVKLRSFPAED